EWLAERGDGQAEGLRWMVAHDKNPVHDTLFSTGPSTWDWWSMLPGWNGGFGDKNDRSDRLEPALMQALDEYHRKSNWSGECAYCEYLTRSDAEAALCRVLAAKDEAPRPG